MIENVPFPFLHDQTFEVYVASGLAELLQSFGQDRERIWLVEKSGQIISSIVGFSKIEEKRHEIWGKGVTEERHSLHL
jgi:hypothetical protein